MLENAHQYLWQKADWLCLGPDVGKWQTVYHRESSGGCGNALYPYRVGG